MSSSGSEPTVGTFIEASLVTLREECPEAYYLMCLKLAGSVAALRVDDDEISLIFDRRGVSVAAGHPRADVRIGTSRQTILDILDARRTLQEAVDAGGLELWGDIADLEAFHEALLLYVHGAVRCPSFSPLLDEFRDAYFMTIASPTPGSNSSQL